MQSTSLPQSSPSQPSPSQPSPSQPSQSSQPLSSTSQSPSQKDSRIKRLAPLFIVLAGCCWGCMGIFVRTLNASGLFAMQISEIRCIVTALIMLTFMLIFKRGELHLHLRDLWCFIGTGILSILLFNYCYFSTIETSSLGVAAVLLYTSPIFVMLLSWPLFKERITALKVFALALTFGGCILVSGILTGTATLSPAGIVTGICAGLGYALYSIFSRYALLRGYTPLAITTWTFIVAALGGALLADMNSIATAISGNAGLVAFMVGGACVVTVIPYALYTVGLQQVENSRASIMVSTEPVVATLVGFFVFAEVPTPLVLTGMILVVSAIIILALAGRKKK